MAIYRTRKDKDNPYVMLNKHFLNDNQLSYKAKGLLAYLLSKPDDWIVMERELMKASKDSRDSIRSGIKELIEAGYIIRNQVRGTEGRYQHAEYDVYEVPRQEEPEQSGESAGMDRIFKTFADAGATIEPTPEVKEMLAKAIKDGKAKTRARARWG